MAFKPSYVGMFRGGMYAASIALPAKNNYDQIYAALGGDSNPQAKQQALDGTMKTLLGMDWQTGNFDWATMKQTYAPFFYWTVIDTVASKAGVWKKMGRLFSNFGL